jgi:hypothetical protein
MNSLLSWLAAQFDRLFNHHAFWIVTAVLLTYLVMVALTGRWQ